MTQIDVGVLGATGMVGQQFIALLANHPWIKVTWVGASQRSEGKAYKDAAAWRLAAPLSDRVAALEVRARDVRADDVVGAVEFGWHAAIVIGQAEAQRAHTVHREQLAEPHVAAGVGVPLREDEHGGAVRAAVRDGLKPVPYTSLVGKGLQAVPNL